MTPAKPKSNYRVLPLPRVQREARKMLTAQQLHEGIKLARRLRFYPNDPELSYEPCGDGMELRVESPDTPNIKKQGWLRAIFWVHEKSRIVFLVDVFWKKSNQIKPADVQRANHRIRLLKAQLAAGGDPWKSDE
jgi:phage-related protein